MVANNKIKTYQTIREGLSDNFIDGLVGVNKTGKSSVMRNIGEIWRGSHSAEMEMHGHDPQHMFRGLIPEKNLIDAEDKLWALKCCELRNCFLGLDEINLLCPTPQHPPKGLNKLFSQAFFWNISIAYSTHNPALIPEICTYYTKYYHIFLTYSREGQFQKKIPNYTLCLFAANYVNKYVSKYGRGRHPLSKDFDGQKFPYMIVDTERQICKAVNMNKPI